MLSRLFPWYRWTDRWTLHIEELGGAIGSSTIEWTAPVGYRFELLAVLGELTTSAIAANRYVHVDALRANVTYARTSSWLLQLASRTIQYNFGRYLNVFQSSLRDNTAPWPLPANFILLPHDRLNIYATDGQALDSFDNWLFVARKWID